MAQLVWNDTGNRRFEIGVDRGVLYKSDGTGVAWNGLTAVTETPSGGEPTPYYLDGVKYLNVAGHKEFGGTIEAHTYPDAFAEYDGWVDLGNGLIADEQPRKPFGLSYRTLLGNDVDGADYGYKIHLVYNALAAPSENAYESISDELSPLSFSWDFTTTPINARSSLVPMSHVVIDSTKTNPTQMSFIEQYLYGTASQRPSMPPLELMLSLFDNPLVTLIITSDTVSGLSPLSESASMAGDLRGRTNEGIYLLPPGSRLTESGTAGIYTLGAV